MRIETIALVGASMALAALADAGAPGEGVPWIPSEKAAFDVRGLPEDWTAGGADALTVRLYSARAVPSRILLYIGSENAETLGPDYYSAMIPLDFTGWKTFRFRYEDFGRGARSPLGWNRITGVRLLMDGWGLTPHPDASLRVGAFRRVKTLAPDVTDTELFEALDLSSDGMESVRAAVLKGDYSAAKTGFARHLKSRTSPVWFFDWRKSSDPSVRNPGFRAAGADRICGNLLRSCGIEHQFGERIDWSVNPTKLKYSEWTWQLSRHPFWSELGRAYWATGDEKYARAYVRQITGWIKDNPVPTRGWNGVGSRWRTIEAGIRAFSSWPESFFRFLGSPSFDDESIILVVKSFYEHARHLRMHPTQNNWLCMEMNGLYHIGALFPEFKDAAEWRSYASGRLYEEMNIQIYPDGSQRELAPGYHGVSLHNFIGIYRIARINGYPLPEDYVKRLERMFDCYVRFRSPTGNMPAFNDSGWGGVDGELGKALEFFPERADFRWFSSGGKEGRKPDYTSCFMPWAGWYNMRTGWGRDDLMATFEVGPFGAAHQHEDKLSFVLYAFGKRLLTEAGVYAYDTSQWRRYVLSARAHNVVRVDGLDQNRRERGGDFRHSEKPLDNRWITGPDYDFGEGIYDEGFGPHRALKVSHARAMLFVKSRGWLVFDVMTPSDDKEHEYTSWFHFDTPAAVPTTAFTGAVTTEASGPNLLVAALRKDGLGLSIVSGQEDPEVQGWVPAKGYDVRPVATPVFTRKATGQHVEPYLFLPIAQGAENPLMSAAQVSPNVYEIRWSDGTKTVVRTAPGADGRLETLAVSQIAADGTAATHRVL